MWFNVLWNGKHYGLFKSMRGVWQGDPLSASLFILTMEWFSRQLNNKVNEKQIMPFHTRRGAISVTHLIFADDLLVFTNDNTDSFQALTNLIEEFCAISGEKLHPDKSQIFFGNQTSEDQKHRIIATSGFKEGKLSVMYLGVPLIRGRICIDAFDTLIDKMKKKIGGWSRNLLSFAGRVTLVKAVLQSMSIHTTTTIPILATVIRRLNSLISNFVWNAGPVQLSSKMIACAEMSIAVA